MFHSRKGMIQTEPVAQPEVRNHIPHTFDEADLVVVTIRASQFLAVMIEFFGSISLGHHRSPLLQRRLYELRWVTGSALSDYGTRLSMLLQWPISDRQ